MELSKEFRYLLFKTPKIMKKVKLVITKARCSQNILEFVTNYGAFVRCLSLNFGGKSDNTIKYILHHVPNLDELEYENPDELYKYGFDMKFNNIEKVEEPIKMSRLKKLKLTTNNFHEFRKNIEKLDNLEEFFVNLKENNDEKNLVNFLIEQHNLKILSIKLKFSRNPIFFPNEDMTQNIKFHLEVLKLKFNHESDINFMNFLRSQASSLEEMDVKCSSEEFLEILFNKCNKLTKLTYYGTNSQIYSELYPHWTLKKLKFLTDYSNSAQNLNLVYRKFPNIIFFKCCQLADMSGTFDKLAKLEINTVFIENFKNIKLPNLIFISIKSLERIGDEINWQMFIQNMPKLKNLQIYSLKCKTDHEIIFKFIKNFTNLKYFEIWYFVEFDIVRSNTIERVQSTFKYEDPMPHNICIDFVEKIVKSDNIKLNKKIMQGQFENFKQTEFKNSEILFNFKNLYLRPFDYDSDY